MSTTRTPRRQKRTEPMFWSSIPTARACGSSPTEFVTASDWRRIQRPASCGARSTSATDLGDNLVPDYITHVQDGGFYGWPWWYMGSHQDPRHAGQASRTQRQSYRAGCILNPHNASLGSPSTTGSNFPAEYQGDIFGAEHGSWNRAVRVGYELIRVPLHQTGHASGEYQDFMTGFVVDNEHVWGRPVSVTVAPDGSLLVTDDTYNAIWRIAYTGN